MGNCFTNFVQLGASGKTVPSQKLPFCIQSTPEKTLQFKDKLPQQYRATNGTFIVVVMF
jgi:hypothetical protein